MNSHVKSYWRVGELFNGAPWAALLTVSIAVMVVAALVLS